MLPLANLTNEVYFIYFLMRNQTQRAEPVSDTSAHVMYSHTHLLLHSSSSNMEQHHQGGLLIYRQVNRWVWQVQQRAVCRFHPGMTLSRKHPAPKAQATYSTAHKVLGSDGYRQVKQVSAPATPLCVFMCFMRRKVEGHKSDSLQDRQVRTTEVKPVGFAVKILKMCVLFYSHHRIKKLYFWGDNEDF